MPRPLKPRDDGSVNLTLSPDAVAALQKAQEQLTSVLGFKPTYSQALVYLAHNCKAPP